MDLTLTPIECGNVGDSTRANVTLRRYSSTQTTGTHYLASRSGGCGPVGQTTSQQYWEI